MTFSDLKSKEVVRLEDGKKLGFIDDLIFDDSVASVVAFRIPLQTKMFKKPEYITIDINLIDKIGENVILIKSENTSIDSNANDGEYYYSPKVFKRASCKHNS